MVHIESSLFQKLHMYPETTKSPSLTTCRLGKHNFDNNNLHTSVSAHLVCNRDNRFRAYAAKGGTPEQGK